MQGLSLMAHSMIRILEPKSYVTDDQLTVSTKMHLIVDWVPVEKTGFRFLSYTFHIIFVSTEYQSITRFLL